MSKILIMGFEVKQLAAQINPNLTITDFVWKMSDGRIVVEYGIIAQHILNGLNGERIMKTRCIPFTSEEFN